MPQGFNLESYLRNSKKVDVSDLDFSLAKRYPLTADEVRCLTYMMDIESHTIVYLRGILNTCAIEDTETTAFLNCWAYEEFYHGRTIRQFLEAAGHEFSPDRAVQVKKRTSFREWLKDMGASFVCQLSAHFHGAYLSYGAISELTTLEGYGVVARRTHNPLLANLMLRLAKDERRHFSFYYNKAREELVPRNAQRLTTFILKQFWMPVGGGVKPDPEVDWMMRYILGDAPGAEIARRIDATIARLPGLDWFDGISRNREAALVRAGYFTTEAQRAQRRVPSFELRVASKIASANPVTQLES
ncbi:MAG: acyl-ACP desaturase [Acidobacteria bacterium]|nr:acyl-ACP desaturase [Acidobacteriota bacterium]